MQTMTTMQTVQHLLDNKTNAFNTVTPDTLVIDALNYLNSLNLSYVIVMDNGVYKGLFSERDYSRNVILKGRTSATATVQEVMTTDLPIVATTDTIDVCVNLINTFKTRYLLAYDEDERFAGVITIHDLLRHIPNMTENGLTTAVSLFSETEQPSIY